MADDNQLYRESTLDGFASEKINVVANGLLGTYDKSGNYTISRPLKEELLKLTKYKKRNFNNSIFCVSFKPDFGEYSFKVDYEKNSRDNVAKATLYLIETIYKVNGYIQDTINTKIGEYTNVLDDKFIENSYVALNISNKWVDDGEGEGKEYIGEDDKPHPMVYLQAYERYLDTLDDLTAAKFNKLCEEFFEAKLLAMRSLKSPFAKEVLDLFSAEYAKIEKTFIIDKDFKSLNELFDVCVERAKLSKQPVTPEETAKQTQEQEYFNKIKDAQEKFEQGVNKLYQKSIEKTVNKMPTNVKDKVEAVLKPAPAPEPVVQTKEEPKKPAPSSKPTPKAPEKKEATAKKESGSKTFGSTPKDISSIINYVKAGKITENKEDTKKTDKETPGKVPGIKDSPKPADKYEKPAPEEAKPEIDPDLELVGDSVKESVDNENINNIGIFGDKLGNNAELTNDQM